MNRIHRTYSKEFKEKAIVLSYQRDNLKELAEELGIHVDRLYDWRKIFPAPSSGSNNRKANSDRNIKCLERELRDTKMELEILKKAIHIFSKSGGKNINL